MIEVWEDAFVGPAEGAPLLVALSTRDLHRHSSRPGVADAKATADRGKE